MKYRLLGNTEEKLSAVGLGCMTMSSAYGTPDDKESIAALELAIDLGINFWDTADIYGNGVNEEFLAPMLKAHRDKIFIATKFGFKSNPGEKGIQFDASPAYMKIAVEKSLKRLGVDVIDLYYAHRVDPNVPIEETVGAMAQLVTEGKIRYLGLSEASATSIRKAHAVHPISALQSEYSVLTRDVEEMILPLTKELGISFVPFSPLARGLMTNTLDVSTLADNDFRKALPRYQQEYQDNNTKLTQGFAEIAAGKNGTAAQLALAWVLAQGEHIIPIPGTKKRKYLEQNAKAVDMELSSSDAKAIEDLLAKYPNTGPRYNEDLNKLVDKD
ncbi:aldo/keto reductase [Mucilaginibacter aquaedulcis]|uniref:aldo/keto reductase n=1 Tax=Mucilaginibacter aquaedulcis TaxID=1187081 RepID=UPI0025B4B63F|nr:aldo/keto reductase [Mucilaginibacter aquaedulcis]MDN3548466.1 aldo/keto reductase [Mucilaginibacter aquaedulcis]